MKKLMLLSLLGVGLMAAPSAQAQPVVFGVGVGPVYFGAPPVCAYGYYPTTPTRVRLTATMDRTGSSAGSSLARGPGSTAGMDAPAMGAVQATPGRGYARPGYAGREGFRGGPVARGPVGWRTRSSGRREPRWLHSRRLSRRFPRGWGFSRRRTPVEHIPESLLNGRQLVLPAVLFFARTSTLRLR